MFVFWHNFSEFWNDKWCMHTSRTENGTGYVSTSMSSPIFRNHALSNCFISAGLSKSADIMIFKLSGINELYDSVELTVNCQL